MFLFFVVFFGGGGGGGADTVFGLLTFCFGFLPSVLGATTAQCPSVDVTNFLF